MSFPLLSLLAAAGYDGPPRATPLRILTLWTFDPVLVLGLSLAAGLYLAGVYRLRERGDAWPAGRTVAFLAGGIGTVALATLSGLAAYDDTLFSAHMTQHMILSMVSPVFLALGAPVTLALRTLPSRPRRGLLRLLRTPVVAVLTNPLVAFSLFIASPFVLYFTSIYQATLVHAPLHELLHLHLLVVGCLFFWPLLGIDPLPGRIAHPFRLLLAFVSLPFHAFLGIAIMSRDSVIASSYYLGLHRPWSADLLADQRTGGGLLWASGDIVGLVFLVTIVVQWMRADERAAVREDRRLDRLEAAEQRSTPGFASADARPIPQPR